MTMLEVFSLLRRRGWIIVILAVLTAASAYVFSVLQTEVWQSSVRILVEPARPDFGLTQSAKTVLRSYVQWLRTETNAQIIINELQLDRTAESLLSDVVIDSEDENFVIQIDVRNEDPRIASAVALRWAELFTAWRKQRNQEIRLEDNVNALILDQPTVTLYRPQTRINVLAGAILGGLLGGLIIFFLEYIEAGMIRSRQDVERALGLSVLGAVPAVEGGRRK